VLAWQRWAELVALPSTGQHFVENYLDSRERDARRWIQSFDFVVVELVEELQKPCYWDEELLIVLLVVQIYSLLRRLLLWMQAGDSLVDSAVGMDTHSLAVATGLHSRAVADYFYSTGSNADGNDTPPNSNRQNSQVGLQARAPVQELEPTWLGHSYPSSNQKVRIA
jgi:hypothetical protein